MTGISVGMRSKVLLVSYFVIYTLKAILLLTLIVNLNSNRYICPCIRSAESQVGNENIDDDPEDAFPIEIKTEL